MEIREMVPGDIDQVVQIEKVAWGDRAATRDIIGVRADVFGCGSLVAVQTGKIVGYAAAQLTDHISTHSWAKQTDNGMLEQTHRPYGRLAYGVSMSASPGVRGEGVAFHVIAHYTKIFLDSGRCSALCVGSRLPGFARWTEKNGQSGALTSYVQSMPDGRPKDPELRLYAASGFRILWELPYYFPDQASMDHGAMVIRSR